jgi:hypothetical protein
MSLPISRRAAMLGGIAAVVTAGCKGGKQDATQKSRAEDPEMREIAKDAYIYGFPLVDSYRIQYSYFVNKDDPEYKGGWNEIHSTSRVYTPADKAVQTPNSDTPYSMLGADLRAEPLVISVAEVKPKERYYSAQFVDMYTYNFDYFGSRESGNGAGNYLLTGPDWTGNAPPQIKKVIRSETQFALVVFRTQLFNPGDIENVKRIQAGYKVQTLSDFVLKETPKAMPAVDFIVPATPEEERKSLRFYDVLNFVLRYCPVNPTENKLMDRFRKIGIGPDANFEFDSAKLPSEMKKALEDGMADAWKEFETFKTTQVDTGRVGSADGFGTRLHLRNNYMLRMSSAILGIYGNSKEEALYTGYFVDSTGQKPTGTNRYTLQFAAGELPPVNAFWSLTMYELPQSLLVENPLHRYLINSPMLPGLKSDEEGGLTLYIQHDAPDRDKVSNWLPAPGGPFFAVLRLYWPKQQALDGTWKAPALERVS